MLIESNFMSINNTINLDLSKSVSKDGTDKGFSDIISKEDKLSEDKVMTEDSLLSIIFTLLTKVNQDVDMQSKLKDIEVVEGEDGLLSSVNKEDALTLLEGVDESVLDDLVKLMEEDTVLKDFPKVLNKDSIKELIDKLSEKYAKQDFNGLEGVETSIKGTFTKDSLEVLPSSKYVNPLGLNIVKVNDDKDLSMSEDVLGEGINDINMVVDNVGVNTIKSTENTTSEAKVELPRVRLEYIVEDIAKNLKYLKDTEGVQKLKLQMSPKDLGNIQVEVTKVGEVSKVLLTLERAELYDVLQKHIKELNSQLSMLNAKIEEVNVELKTDANKYSFNGSGLNGDNKSQQDDKRFKGVKSTTSINEGVVEIEDDVSNIISDYKVTLRV